MKQIYNNKKFFQPWKHNTSTQNLQSYTPCVKMQLAQLYQVPYFKSSRLRSICISLTDSQGLNPKTAL